MRVLVLGAGGFIGRHAARALEAAGHEVIPARVDFGRMQHPESWHALMPGVDAVINAVGIFRESHGAGFEAIHDTAPRALFAACEAAGVRRVIQVSALGADGEARSRFHLSKRRADEFLATRDLAWTIVQPSLVFGSDGASARLFARMAALPLIPLPGDGGQRVQPIHVEDLAGLLLRLVEQDPPRRETIAAVGPRALSMRAWLETLRTQMALGKARVLRVPLPLVRLAIGSEALGMLMRGNTASPVATERILGRPARDPAAFVSPGERGFLALRARLDSLLSLLKATVALTWIVSGIVSFGLYPAADSLEMLARVGLSGMPAYVALYGAAAIDIALGVAIYAWPGRWGWRLQLAVIVVYTAILTVFIPELWLHPFGPLLKNIPLAAAILLLHEFEARR